MPTQTVSTRVSNLTSSPQTLDPQYERGTTIVNVETLGVTTAMVGTTANTIVIGAVPSGAEIDAIVIYNDQLDSGSALTYSLGFVTLEKFADVLENTNIVAGATQYAALAAVGSASLLVSVATTLQSANKSGTEVRFSAEALSTANKRVWELCSLQSDPHKLFALQITIGTIAGTGVAGNLNVKISYKPVG